MGGKTMILQSLRLTFDPATERPEVQEVFADDLARMLWLAIKQGHNTSQYFCENLLLCAAEIKRVKEKGVLDAEVLFHILSGLGRGPLGGVIGPCEQKFAVELLPFVNGDETITYEFDKTVLAEKGGCP